MADKSVKQPYELMLDETVEFLQSHPGGVSRVFVEYLTNLAFNDVDESEPDMRAQDGNSRLDGANFYHALAVCRDIIAYRLEQKRRMSSTGDKT